MRLSLRFLCSLLSVSLFASMGHAVHAQSAAAVASHARVTAAVQPGQTARLIGHIPSWAANANDQGAVTGSTQLTNLHLVLSRAPEVQAAFESLLVDLYNPASPRYHQWLTPAQNAAQYGIAPSDLQAVTDWLSSQGLRVDDVAAGGVFITFSGSSSAVERAFATTLHNFAHDNLSLRAPIQEPAVPSALAGVIQSVAGLDDTRMKPHSTPRKLVAAKNDTGSSQPDLNASNGSHYLSPGDFNTIYDIVPAATAGYTGTGQKVLILGYSHIAAADITNYENFFSLGVTTQPTTYLLSGSTDPGTDGVNGWQGENTLDIERVIGTAPGAAIDFSIAATSSYTNTFAQLQWNISTQNDKIVSMSFGSGESSTSSSTVTSFDTYLQTGAAQGITALVSSGDTGAAGGDTNGSPSPTVQVLEINLICASSYITCVGGTEFSETTTNASTYWSATNSSTKSSALSYIPEGGWNDLQSSGGQYYPSASGGGASQFITKPTWQTGTGVPADGKRDAPDVSFTASGAHDGYVLCITDPTSGGGGCVATTNPNTSNTFYTTGGTSASAPSMAGVVAILNQRLGTAQGNLNPLLYGFAATSPAVFHDVTVASSGVSSCAIGTPSLCNNSTPATTSATGGLNGYLVTAGYDQVTGLGSIDVNNLLLAASVTTTPTFTVTPASTTLTLYSGATTGNTDNITVAPVSGFTGAVTMTCTVANGSGTAAGSCALASGSVTLSSTSSVTDLLTITTTPGTAGVLNVTVKGVNGSTTVTSSTIVVTLTASGYTMTANPTTTSVNAGISAGSQITLTSQNGFAGTVAVSCAGSFVPTGGSATATTCSANPTSVVLTAGGTGTTMVTIPTTAGVGGVLTATISGSGIPTGGTVAATASTSVAVTVVAPAITAAAASNALPVSGTLVSGTNVTDVITFTSSNGFVGTVTPSCAVSAGAVTPAPTCSFSPSTIALTSGGTGTTTMTVASTPGSSGTASISITGSGTSTGASAPTTSNATLVTVTLTKSTFTATPATAGGLSILSGATTGNTEVVTFVSVNGFAGTITPTCSVTGTVTPAPTCAFSPLTVALAAGGSVTATLTVTSTAGTAGTVSLAVTATGTTTGASASYTASFAQALTLTTPTFTLSASPSALSFVSGATTGNTSVVTLTSTNGFAGPISTITCTVAVTSGAYYPATCAMSATTGTLTAGGMTTSTLTISSTTAHAMLETPSAPMGRGIVLAGGTLFAALLLLPGLRRRRLLRSLAALGVLFFGIAGLNGCGGSSTPAPPATHSSAGTYVVTVTATGTNTGASVSTSASTTVSLTIN